MTKGQRVVVGFLDENGKPTTLVIGRLALHSYYRETVSQYLSPYVSKIVPGMLTFDLKLYDVKIEDIGTDPIISPD